MGMNWISEQPGLDWKMVKGTPLIEIRETPSLISFKRLIIVGSHSC
jgi:hypothetical protein